MFSQCFLIFRRLFYHFHQIWNCRLQTLSVWKGKTFVILERVILNFIQPPENDTSEYLLECVYQWEVPKLTFAPGYQTWKLGLHSTSQPQKMGNTITAQRKSFRVSLFQTSSCFYVSAPQVFLKTPWEKEKLLIKKQFLLFPKCFLPV